ncbi:uncharacterized protein B0T15DRAFT_307269 [Chaetomium strumarium]|uniref:C2H2-type domain-containing protein n=1 Tax=Chaetomium strumarium TaxID=1170767 RepID=A0AAJ0GM44_9PEZI|nr:hypothetical protein B0T15DRAFT_307269 [Chaetomium strumarium]
MKRPREPEEAPLEEATTVVRNTAATYGNDHGSGLEQIIDNGADSLPPAAKIAELDTSESEEDREVKIYCALPPHKEPLQFSSYGNYETHYRDKHTNRCLQCRKNFPSAHFLSLHIEETHDSFSEVRKERGERTFSCFVEGCDKKCTTPHKRKMHLIDKHMYPRSFFFAITREGIDGRQSLLQERPRRRRESTSAMPSPRGSFQGQGQRPVADQPQASADSHVVADSTEKETEQQPDQEMEDLAGAMAALRFVPMSVRFGRGKKAGFAKR